MRKALLVLALIAASFGGGAVVNGPGLQMAKDWVRQQLEASPAPEADAENTVTEPDPFPTAPGTGIPLVSSPPAEAPPAAPAASPPAGAIPPGAPSGADGTPAPPAPASPAAPLPAATDADAVPRLTPPEAAPVAEAPTPAPLASPPAPEPPATGTVPAPPLPRPADTESGEPGVAGTAAVGSWGDAPDSQAPAGAVVPGRPLPPLPGGGGPIDGQVQQVAEPTGATPAATAADTPEGRWDLACQKMQKLGVSRFWVEGEPGQKVRFRCLIPLAGEGAVAQQFEAEGPDLPSAAESAVKRVALWRAAHPSP